MKRLREARGLSQTKLAARADLNPATVNQIERGKREASPATLHKLAEALGVSLYELLEGESHPKAPRRSSPEPRLFNGLEGDERRLGYLRMYRDELMATAAHARALLEGAGSLSAVDGWDAAPETALSLWTGEINFLHEDARWRAEVWGADLEGASGQDLPREEKELVDEVRRGLRAYEETAKKLLSRLEEEWARLRERNPREVEAIQRRREEIRHRTREISA